MRCSHLRSAPAAVRPSSPGPWLALLTLVAALACQPSPPATPCGDNKDCPKHYTCDAAHRVCVPKSDHSEDLVCGKVALFRDDPAAGAPCGPWGHPWTSQTASVGEADGELVFTLRPATGSVSEARCESALAASLKDSAVVMQLAQAFPADVNGYLAMRLSDHLGAWLEMSQSHDQIRIEIAESYQAVHSSTFDYDAALEPWWRIGESDGKVAFAVAADGESWRTLFTTSTPELLDNVRLDIIAWASSGQTTNFEVRIASLNPDQENAGWCPLGQLKDDFQASALASVWRTDYSDDACQVSVEGGRLQFLAPGTASLYCDLRSLQGYDLDEEEIVLELVDGGAPGTFTGLTLADVEGSEIEFGLYADMLAVWVSRNDNNTDTEWHEVAAPSARWLRVSKQGGNVKLESRASREDDWDHHFTVDRIPTMPATTVAISTWRDADAGAVPATVQLRFDNVNLP